MPVLDLFAKLACRELGVASVVIWVGAGETARIEGAAGPDAQGFTFSATVALRAAGATIGELVIGDPVLRPMDATFRQRLTEITEMVEALVAADAVTDMAERLSTALAANAALVRERAAAAAHYKKMYDRASALARIGVWECDLATGRLTWTDGVYDLFELPRGSVVDRATTLAMYEPTSRREMERLRAQAIATCGGFTHDVQIRTAQGNARWIRLTVDVECADGEAVRIFGTKQDITEERQLWTRMRRMAEEDPLTGLANRAVFEADFSGSGRGPLGALVLIDLDGFKQVNDTFGHAAGDHCLREVAARLRQAWPGARLVARIGGDEFAVLIGASADLGTVDAMVTEGLTTALREISRPIVWGDTTLYASASIGVASPDDPLTFDAAHLFAEADAALYASKAAGKGISHIQVGAVSGYERRSVRGSRMMSAASRCEVSP